MVSKFDEPIKGAVLLILSFIILRFGLDILTDFKNWGVFESLAIRSNQDFWCSLGAIWVVLDRKFKIFQWLVQW